MIIGYYPKKLISALKLKAKVDLSGKTAWLSQKYDKIFSAAIRVTRQLSPAQLEQQVPWRPETVRELILHILSFPELAWRSHKHGSMSTEDMRACKERLNNVATVEAISRYGESVRRNLIQFLNSGDTAAFDRVVQAHYGGEVTVVELLNIILSHSTHHLKQLCWHMENDLGLSPDRPATEADLEGIVTPIALI